MAWGVRINPDSQANHGVTNSHGPRSPTKASSPNLNSGKSQALKTMVPVSPISHRSPSALSSPALSRYGAAAASPGSSSYFNFSGALDSDLYDNDSESDYDDDTLTAMLMETNGKAQTDAFLRDVRRGKGRARPEAIKELLQKKKVAGRRKLADALGDLFDMLNFVMSHEPERATKANMLKSMREIAKDAGPCLAELLADSDTGVRISSIRSIGKMARYANQNTKRLEDRLTDKSSAARRCLVACLVIIRCCSMRLHGTLDTDRDPEAVQSAVTVLENRGNAESVKSVVRLSSIGAVPCPQLLALLCDENPDIRGAAACALGQHGPRAAPYANQLLELLRAGDSNTRICATIAFRKMGGAAMSQVETLLQDDDHIMRRSAVGVLMTILATTPSSEVTQLAFALVRDAPSEHGPAATMKLVRTGEVRGLELATLLQDADAKVRCTAATALGELGSQAAPYILHLIPLLKDPDKVVRDTAIQSVKGIDGFDGFESDVDSISSESEAEDKSMIRAYKVYNHLRDAYEDNSFRPITMGNFGTFGTAARQFQKKLADVRAGSRKSWLPGTDPKPKGAVAKSALALRPDKKSADGSQASTEAPASPLASPGLSEEANLVQHAVARRVSQVVMAAQSADIAAALSAEAISPRPQGLARSLTKIIEDSEDKASEASADDMMFGASESLTCSTSAAPGMFSIGGSASRMSLVPISNAAG